MGLDQVAIQLDNPTQVFYPGQTITGKISVSVTQEATTINGIFLQLKGWANVWFTKRYGQTTVPFFASETYFDINIPIYNQNRDPSDLSVGQHEYRFAYILPHGIPCSYDSTHGKVRYYMKAVVERSWKTNYTCKLPFCVNNIVDLNTIQAAELPTDGTKSKTLGVPPFNSKPITGKVWLDRVGYVPGESILVNARADNQSKSRMRDCRIRLVEIAEYYASGQKHISTRILNQVSHGPFDKLMEWDRVPIMVPPVAPSGLPFCSIITIGYRIQLIVDPRALSVNLTTSVNVIIGSVPLRSRFTSFRGEVSPTSPPLLLLSEKGSVPVDYANMPPPTYEQSMFEVVKAAKDKSEEADELPFKPMYATYTSNEDHNK